MAKQGKGVNNRLGGHPKATAFRQIVADPAGNREQRRAAKKLAKRAAVADGGESRG